MTNPWKEMNTSDLYGALLSKDSEKAMQDLIRAKRAMELNANRYKIKLGHKLMNKFAYYLQNQIIEDKEYDEELSIFENDNCLVEVVEEFVRDNIKEIREFAEFLK